MAQAGQQGQHLVALAGLLGWHGQGQVALGDAGRQARGLVDRAQDRAGQPQGADHAQQQAHHRARHQQADALALAAQRRSPGLGHALALVLGQLVHGRGIALGSGSQQGADRVFGNGFTGGSLLDELVAGFAKDIAGLVNGGEQIARSCIGGQCIQAFAHLC